MSRKTTTQSFRAALTAASVVTVGGGALLVGALTGGSTAAAPLPPGPVLTISSAPSSSVVASSAIVPATTSAAASITLTTATTTRAAAPPTPTAKPTRSTTKVTVKPPPKPVVETTLKPTTVKATTPAPAPMPAGPASTVALPWGSAGIVDATVQDGTLEPPDDPRTVGIWTGGAALGDTAGTVLLTSHVNYHHVSGIFEPLSTLAIGQHVTTADAHGVTTRWTVSSAYAVSKSGSLPAGIFAGKTGPRRLVLVTCGGAYDAAAHNYLSNVIVELEPA